MTDDIIVAYAKQIQSAIKNVYSILDHGVVKKIRMSTETRRHMTCIEIPENPGRNL